MSPINFGTFQLDATIRLLLGALWETLIYPQHLFPVHLNGSVRAVYNVEVGLLVADGEAQTPFYRLVVDSGVCVCVCVCVCVFR